MTEKFEILTAREHVQRRIGMYMGSASKETVERFVLGKWKVATYVPALSKMIDEILDNSVDEAIRTGFKFANKIDVSVKENKITVTDNGRGIPQEDVLDATTGKKIPRPVAAWTKTNAGTSFNDDRVTIGTNGVGSAATNFLSASFHGRTWRDGKLIEVVCTSGSETVKVNTRGHAGNGTEVSFIPDFTWFETESLAELDTLELLEDRLVSLQLAFPEIKFTFNGKKLIQPDLRRYAELFTEGSSVLIKEETLAFFFSASEDGFRTTSYTNGVNTRQGGAYVDFVVNGVVDELVSMIKRKHKIDVVKSTIKGGLTFVLFARNFTNPKFDSQTKERLTNTAGQCREHYEAAGGPEFKKLAQKIMAAEDIIQPIIAAQLAKKEIQDTRAAIQAQKKLKKVKVAKHVAANRPDATLKVVEGDSAMGFLLKVRDANKVGAFPLRGVIMNTWDMKPADVLKNKELGELVAVLGLDISDPDSVDQMTYKEVAALTDADHDGAGHISPLLIAFFYKFWPRLVTEGRVLLTRTPMMISTNGKSSKWFYNYGEAQTFKQNNPKWNHRYIKGLGSLTEVEYHTIINEPVYDVVSVDDANYFQLMFGDDAAPRKEFMTA